jgi:hypothetical protein
MGPHWDENKKDKEYQFVLVEFEEIRDGLSEDAIAIEELKKQFPDQVWSPQSSGIEIRKDYRDELHKLWNQGSETHWLLKLFQTYIEDKSGKEWPARYRETTQQVATAKNDHSLLDEDLLETIWYRTNNGIAHPGRGQLPRAIFETLLPKLRDFTLSIFEDPSKGTFDKIISEFETLKASDEVKRTPHLVIRRAFAAISPETLATIVNVNDLITLAANLKPEFGQVVDPNADWFEQNYQLRSFLKENGIDDSDLATFNTFCWHLHDYLQNRPPVIDPPVTGTTTMISKNIILYGPPGTGKTYALKDRYFDLFTDTVEAITEEKWIEQNVDPLTWHEVLAAVLYDMGSPARVPEIAKHPYLRVPSSKGFSLGIW